jgi:hypothetical protein
MNNTFSKKNILTAIALITFGATGRILLQDLPNIETIMVVSLLAGVLLGGPWTLIVGLSTIAITDAAIGNTSILLYTWSAWAVMGVFGWMLRNRTKNARRLSLELTGMGILGTLFFFLWSNFGVWQIGGLYPATFDGLVQSYVAALPFLRMHMISTLLIVPTVSFVALKIWSHKPAHATMLHPVTVTHDNRG